MFRLGYLMWRHRRSNRLNESSVQRCIHKLYILQFSNSFSLIDEGNNMLQRLRIVLIHLRIPFSFFLLPVFIFGLSQSTSIDFTNSLVIFIILHFLIYPASNAYNSFMDKDTGPIGLLKNPPPVNKDIYVASIFLDIAGLTLAFFININMFLLMLVYILISKSYSWSRIRLKKYPITGWIVVVLFQGGFTFLMVSMSAENNFTLSWFTGMKSEAILLSTLLIGAYYPLTQVYQHEEDAGRGDKTISYKLGIKGTFIFSAIMFIFSFLLSYHYFKQNFSSIHFFTFGMLLLPAIGYFIFWFMIILQNPAKADFRHTMIMTFISSICLLTGFLVLLYFNHFSTR